MYALLVLWVRHTTHKLLKVYLSRHHYRGNSYNQAVQRKKRDWILLFGPCITGCTTYWNATHLCRIANDVFHSVHPFIQRNLDPNKFWKKKSWPPVTILIFLLHRLWACMLRHASKASVCVGQKSSSIAPSCTHAPDFSILAVPKRKIKREKKVSLLYYAAVFA